MSPYLRRPTVVAVLYAFSGMLFTLGFVFFILAIWSDAPQSGRFAGTGAMTWLVSVICFIVGAIKDPNINP